MKKQISRTLLSLAAVLMLAASVPAQTAGVIRVHIPFDFVAGQKQLPAGRYIVRRVRRDSETALLIRAEGGRGSAVILTSAGEGDPGRASLSFRQLGERYFLAEVSMPGTSSVREVSQTGGRRELIEQAKAGGTKKVTVLGSVR